MKRAIITLLQVNTTITDVPGDMLARVDRQEGWNTPMDFSEFAAESGLADAGTVWTNYFQAWKGF